MPHGLTHTCGWSLWADALLNRTRNWSSVEILEASDASLGYDAKKFSSRHPNVSLDALLLQGRGKGDVETILTNRKSAALRA